MRKDKSSEIHIGETIIKTSDFEKLLGIKIEKLHFDDHVQYLCKKANIKLRALARAISYVLKKGIF